MTELFTTESPPVSASNINETVLTELDNVEGATAMCLTRISYQMWMHKAVIRHI